MFLTRSKDDWTGRLCFVNEAMNGDIYSVMYWSGYVCREFISDGG